MKKLVWLFFVLISSLLLNACGILQASPSSTATVTVAPTLTATPDPCAAANLSASVKKVNDLQREFDDASQLASNLSRDQLPDSIASLQRIRRASEDLEVPSCLDTLKTYQLDHMNTVIQTLLAFVGGADQKSLTDGIARARQEHDQYTLEMARLLGITVTPAAVATNTPSK
ncbi:MAG: hypothetical protein M1282_03965 [Chloroflexi bacterium]|nr:hypothetical protein [Chloroflexota bacterium]